MKRFVLSIMTLSVIISFVGCAEENDKLQICGIQYGVQGAYFKPTMQNLIDAPTTSITDKYNNKIATFHDERGTPILDFVMQKIDIKNKPSCYVVLDMFMYKKNKNVPRDGIFMFLQQNYGKPTDTFKLTDIKQKKEK